MPLWCVGATANRVATITKAPIMCHTEEKPFKYADSLVPIVLRIPWQNRMAARILELSQR